MVRGSLQKQPRGRRALVSSPADRSSTSLHLLLHLPLHILSSSFFPIFLFSSIHLLLSVTTLPSSLSYLNHITSFFLLEKKLLAQYAADPNFNITPNIAERIGVNLHLKKCAPPSAS